MRPDTRIRPEELKALGLFRADDLEARVDRPIPDVVREQADVVQRHVVVTLERAACVAPVLLDECRSLSVVAANEPDVDTRLARKLPTITGGPFIDERLV